MFLRTTTGTLRAHSIAVAEAERVGYGFVLPREVVPNVPRKGLFVVTRKTPATGILINRMTETMGV
jgi:hypothetical protein